MSSSGNDKTALDELPPLGESLSDEHPTRMTYQEGHRLPLYVVGVWVCVLAGLGVYFYLHYLSDLQRWGAP